jgi:hypothetical protein
MKQMVYDVASFIRNDLLPNIPFYLLQLFLIVITVLVFTFINVIVRFFTDPVCTKVLRMNENKRGPSTVAFVITLCLTAVLFASMYQAFPQFRPTVLGWAGEKVHRLIFTGKVKIPKLPQEVLDKAKSITGKKSSVASPVLPVPTKEEKAKMAMPDEAEKTPPPLKTKDLPQFPSGP